MEIKLEIVEQIQLIAILSKAGHGVMPELKEKLKTSLRELSEAQLAEVEPNALKRKMITIQINS